MMKLDGVWVASVTFFNQDQSLDLVSLKTHFDWLLDSGVEGLVPVGTTGEGSTLSAKERASVIRLACEVATKKNKKVIAGCGGNSTSEVKTAIQEAHDCGAHAALVVTPYYNRPTQEGLTAHYLNLAEQSPIPLVLYNVPSRTGVNLLPETVHTLWKHPQILGLKEATGSHSQWLSLTFLGIPKDKYLLAGDDDAFATLFALGARGIISASANLIPDQFVKLYGLLAANQWEQAFSLQKKLFPLIRSLFAETNPSPLKYSLSVLGRGQNRLRLPLVPIQNETETLIKNQMEALEVSS